MTLEKKAIKKKRQGEASNYTVFFLLGILFVTLVIKSDSFLSYDSIYSIIYDISIKFFAALGFTLLVITGEVNLAIGSMYGLSGTMVGYCIYVFKWSLWPSIFVVLVVCFAFGWGMGWLITKYRLNSLMVTLGLQSFLQGFNSLVFNAFPHRTYAADYRAIAKFRIGNIHWTIIVMVVVVVVLEIFLRKHPALRKFYYVGSNKETANLYGIKGDKIKRTAFAISMLCAAIGGIIVTSRISYSDMNTGLDLYFNLLISTVVGGVSLAGGRGSIFRAVLGLLFVSLLSNVMAVFNINPFEQQVFMGIVLVLAILADAKMNAAKH